MGAKRYLTTALLIAASQAALLAQNSQSPVVPKRLIFATSSAFNLLFRNPAGVWCDAAHREILVADTGNHRVVILDEHGIPTYQFVHQVTLEGQTQNGEPRSIAVSSKGTIYIVDNLCNTVDVCDYRGDTIGHIDPARYLAKTASGETGSKAAQAMISKPTAVAVDYLDNVYIACPNRILIFNSKGKFRKVMGKTGIGPGEFTAITDIWVDTAGRIYITDAQSLAVQILSPDGKLLLGFGTHNAGVTNFSLPAAICTDRRGDIWLVDTLRQVISAFQRNGDQVVYLDSMGGFGVRPGEVAFPSAIGADWNGRLIIVDRVGGRVQCFDWK